MGAWLLGIGDGPNFPCGGDAGGFQGDADRLSMCVMRCVGLFCQITVADACLGVGSLVLGRHRTSGETTTGALRRPLRDLEGSGGARLT